MQQNMIHLRIDNEELNDKRRFACSLGPELPLGDTYIFEGEYKSHLVTCVGCGGGPRQLGTPISQLSTTPGKPGYKRWLEISKSWGYD
jgi:hypothetical protein